MGWPLLESVPAEELNRVLETARRRRFARNEVVFHEGDPGDALHLIEKGRVAVRVTTPLGDVSTLLVLGPGEIFGELALIDESSSRTATVVALEASETLSIVKSEFDRIRSTHPGVTEVLVTILAQKVGRYTSQLLEALYVPADIRVLRRLLELSNSYARNGEIVIPLTQQDMADLAGTSRATVNRVLREEEAKGTLRLGRGKTVIVNAGEIMRRAQ